MKATRFDIPKVPSERWEASRRVHFDAAVEVRLIPGRHHYSADDQKRIWSGFQELKDMVTRNKEELIIEEARRERRLLRARHHDGGDTTFPFVVPRANREPPSVNSLIFRPKILTISSSLEPEELAKLRQSSGAIDISEAMVEQTFASRPSNPFCESDDQLALFMIHPYLVL